MVSIFASESYQLLKIEETWNLYLETLDKGGLHKFTSAYDRDI